jgi:signal peptidase I
VANSQQRITYDLYKFTKGNVDLVTRPVHAPRDRIIEDNIYVLKDKIEIDIPNAEWSSYEPTGSMEPVLTDTANGLYVLPKGPEDIQVGDIVAYTLGDGVSKDIVHRVIAVTKDENGNYYYTTKGDANPVSDPDLVPYNNIKRILIGILY